MATIRDWSKRIAGHVAFLTGAAGGYASAS